MKAALILIAALSAPVVAQDPRPALTPDQIKEKCAAEGGCVVLTAVQLMRALQEAKDRGDDEGYDTGERKCSRPS